MAPSFVKPSLTSSLLHALFLSFVVFSCSARIVQVVDICKDHIHPSNCHDILYNIPGISGGGVDLNIICPFTIKSAYANALEGLNLINYLIGTTSDPSWKQRYSECSQLYNNAMACLENEEEYYKSRDYDGLKSNASDVVGAVKDCGFGTPNDPSILPTFNNYLEDISIITMNMAEYLNGRP